MDRRAFLLVKTRGRERVLELSCERLYMRWADARSGAGRPADTSVPGDVPAHDPRPWHGEPPTEIVTPTTEDLFGALERALAEADVLRLRGRDWLSDRDFRREVEARVEAFRAGGGRVE